MVIDVVETEQIASLDVLRRIRLADDGYIVIAEPTGKALVHRVNAKCISPDRFNSNVVLKGGKQGAYYWTDTVSTAFRLYGATRCRVCKPEVQVVHPSGFEG